MEIRPLDSRYQTSLSFTFLSIFYTKSRSIKLFNDFADLSYLFLVLEFLLLVGWLFGFYGISTFVGYLTPNSVYMYRHSTKDF